VYRLDKLKNSNEGEQEMKIRKYGKNQSCVYFIPKGCRNWRKWHNNKYFNVSCVLSKEHFINNYDKLKEQYQESLNKLLPEIIGEPVNIKLPLPDIINQITGVKTVAIQKIKTPTFYERYFLGYKDAVDNGNLYYIQPVCETWFTKLWSKILIFIRNKDEKIYNGE